MTISNRCFSNLLVSVAETVARRVLLFQPPICISACGPILSNNVDPCLWVRSGPEWQRNIVKNTFVAFPTQNKSEGSCSRSKSESRMHEPYRPRPTKEDDIDDTHDVGGALSSAFAVLTSVAAVVTHLRNADPPTNESSSLMPPSTALSINAATNAEDPGLRSKMTSPNVGASMQERSQSVQTTTHASLSLGLRDGSNDPLETPIVPPSFPNSLDMPSIGSAGHPHSCNGPCRFDKNGSCRNGASCGGCHYPCCNKKRRPIGNPGQQQRARNKKADDSVK